MLDRVYLEITNLCNLDCTFCHKTARARRTMTAEEFDLLTDKLRGKAKYIYFHLMGEPTLHPLLPQFIASAREKGFLPSVTTNGSLLARRGPDLLASLPYRIAVSLHAPEANPAFADEGYLRGCVDFAKEAAARGCIIALRLWNLGSGADNRETLDYLHAAFPEEWRAGRRGRGGGVGIEGSSHQLAERIYLEWGDRFAWPDLARPECDREADRFCYGLRDQVGVLVDGTVVPCCLDAEGHMALGSLFDSELEEILASPRARAIYDGFSRRRAVEPLCRTCGFAERFSR